MKNNAQQLRFRWARRANNETEVERNRTYSDLLWIYRQEIGDLAINFRSFTFLGSQALKSHFRFDYPI